MKQALSSACDPQKNRALMVFLFDTDFCKPLNDYISDNVHDESKKQKIREKTEKMP